MFNLFGFEEEISSTCIECGKKIKSSHYYSGRGPYGICCYKKLFGTIGLIITKHRTLLHKGNINKNNKKSMCPITGESKNCKQCLLLEDCEDKNE
jgi:hypothetical protein